MDLKCASFHKSERKQCVKFSIKITITLVAEEAHIRVYIYGVFFEYTMMSHV